MHDAPNHSSLTGIDGLSDLLVLNRPGVGVGAVQAQHTLNLLSRKDREPQLLESQAALSLASLSRGRRKQPMRTKLGHNERA
jgi:hypothetical protein